MGLGRFQSKYTIRIAAHHLQLAKGRLTQKPYVWGGNREQREIVACWRHKATQQIWSIGRGCRRSFDSNRSDKSLNPSCAFALWETESTIHRKFINFLQSRGTLGNEPSMSTSPSSKICASTELFTLLRARLFIWTNIADQTRLKELTKTNR